MAVGLGAGAASRWLAPDASPAGRMSYSQQGEDLVLHDLLHGFMRLDHVSYLDIGAADPVHGNNTYLLYMTGSRGVLVEPNPEYVRRLRAVRPEDTVLAIGVGVTDEREADYYVIRGRPELNTFSPDQVAMLRKGARQDVVERIVKMPLVTINDVIAGHLHRAPDVISIDVEGLDLAVLKTLDYDAYRPAAVCAETIRGRTGLNPDIAEFLTAKGYVARGGSLVNTVFVDPARLHD